MNYKAKAVLAFILSALPIALWTLQPQSSERAQAATPAAPQTPPAAAPATPAAPPAAVAGPRLTEQSFGGWVYRCQEPIVDGKPGHQVCELTQDVVAQQDGKPQKVMHVVLAAGPDGKGRSIALQVPLGVRLKQGLSLTIDQGAAQKLDFDFCGPAGCWATMPAPDALIAALKSGTTGRVKIMMLAGQPVTIEFQLAGSAAGIAAFDAGNRPN